MEPIKNGFKVQDILRKFEANKSPPTSSSSKAQVNMLDNFQQDGCLQSPSSLGPSNVISTTTTTPTIVVRKLPVPSIRNSVVHLSPLLELRQSKVPINKHNNLLKDKPYTSTSMDGRKRSVNEIARLFQLGNPNDDVNNVMAVSPVNDRLRCKSKQHNYFIKEVELADLAKSDAYVKINKITSAPVKPVRTFAHDVYVCSKLVIGEPVVSNKPKPKSNKPVVMNRTASTKTTTSSKPSLPPKPVARSKTVPNMPRRRNGNTTPATDSIDTSNRQSNETKSRPVIRRPNGPPPPRPQISRTKSVAFDKTNVIEDEQSIVPLQRSFSDEHIYDVPKGLMINGQDKSSMTASDDEFVFVDNEIYNNYDIYGSNYAPYREPYGTILPKSALTCDIQPKELHYMSTPIVKIPNGQEDIRRCRSRSVSCRKLQRSGGRTLGRRVVTDEDLVNWSFSSVYATTPRRRSHVGRSSNNSGKDNDSGDSETEISEKEVQERIAYIHTISRGSSVRKESRMSNSTYRHQFDAVLTVGLQFSGDGKLIKPFVKHVFPKMDSVKVNLDTVSQFCFPDAESWRPSSNGETYTFVLTNEFGERLFGYCRKVKPEGANSSLPIVYCVISPILARAYYSQVLIEIEKRHGLSDVQMKGFLQALQNRSVPHPGRTIHLRCSKTDVDVRVALSRYNDFGLDNGDTCRLLTRLSICSLLKVYSCMLLERRVLLCSSSLSTLTESVMALVALLYPFSWQHTLVPVLPAAMLDVTASPTPYVIGIMSSARPLLREVSVEEGIVVNLDESELISEVGDEDTILPKKIQKGITASLKFVKHRSEVAGSSSSSLISEAFLTMFTKLVGHYHDHIECLPDGRKIFKRENFCVAPTSRSERLFLEWFTETQMFQIFIENKLLADQHLVQQDVFEKHIEKHRVESEFFKPTIRTNVFGFGKKVKSFGEKLIGIKSAVGKA